MRLIYLGSAGAPTLVAMTNKSLLKTFAAGAAVTAALLSVAPPASASTPPGVVEQAVTLFSGLGMGPTAEAALAAAEADARAQAAAAGFTDCAVAGDPNVFGLLRPGFPLTYVALLTVGCTA